VALAVIVLAMPAFGESRFDEGRWRLELTGLNVFDSPGRHKDGQRYFTGSVEYEFPVSRRGKLGLRLYPLFFHEGSHPIYGAGAGLSARVYQHAEEYTGLFGEVGVSALWHSREFHDNSTRVNFLSEAGIGYQFRKSDWHVTLKVEHISNAGLGGDNAGLNGVGLAVGYTF